MQSALHAEPGHARPASSAPRCEFVNGDSRFRGNDTEGEAISTPHHYPGVDFPANDTSDLPMHEVTIQGSDGGGRYRMTWVGPDEFLAEAEIHQFCGSARASIYHVGSPASFFQDMAEHWRGWSGEKQWGDLDGYVRLLATSDSVGHVSLRVKLCDDTYTHSLEIVLTLEAGHLEATARSVSAWSKLLAQ